MENKTKSNILEMLDSEIVNSYSKESNQVCLSISVELFERFAREVN